MVLCIPADVCFFDVDSGFVEGEGGGEEWSWALVQLAGSLGFCFMSV